MCAYGHFLASADSLVPTNCSHAPVQKREVLWWYEVNMSEIQTQNQSAGGVVSREIRTWLERGLEGGRTELDAAAKHLEVSPRTLRRRLHGEGETFQGLLDDVRRGRALALLTEGTTAISDVSKALGFTRITSFYRAFRRWTETTPASYRSQHSGASPAVAAPQAPIAQAPGAPVPAAAAAAGFQHPQDVLTGEDSESLPASMPFGPAGADLPSAQA